MKTFLALYTAQLPAAQVHQFLKTNPSAIDIASVVIFLPKWSLILIFFLKNLPEGKTVGQSMYVFAKQVWFFPSLQLKGH